MKEFKNNFSSVFWDAENNYFLKKHSMNYESNDEIENTNRNKEIRIWDINK